MLVTIYNQHRYPFLDGIMENIQREKCIYYASEILKDYDYENEISINIAVRRARAICRTLNIPINENFYSIYRSIGATTYVDWKLSPFAAYLTLLNGDPTSTSVASFQRRLYDQQLTALEFMRETSWEVEEEITDD